MKLVVLGLIVGLVLAASLPSILPPAVAGPAPPSLALLADHLDPAEIEGKVVYVDFWASWCAPCQKSFPWMGRVHDAYADEGLVILAVNLDREDAAATKFLDGRDIEFRVLRDPDGELASAFGLKAMPTAFVFGRDGKLAFRHEGFRESEADAVEEQLRGLLSTHGDSR